MIEDVFGSPQILDLRRQLIQECVQRTEMECLSIDATMRCCMPILGQARLKANAQERAEAAFTAENTYRRVTWLTWQRFFRSSDWSIDSNAAVPIPIL